LKKVYDGPTLPLWTRVDVETYSGVKVRCEIVEVRRLGSCAAYTVKPKEDREAELRRAGVPKGDWTSSFTAFDWQVKAVQPASNVEQAEQSTRKVIRKPHEDGRYVST
jgi:hypothetical protein